jgi:hypothetical protein
MLVGNIVAYGGTMINAEFRQRWWPLAAAHVALNLGLLAMERFVTPRRRGARSAGGRRTCSLVAGFAGATGGASLAALVAWQTATLKIVPSAGLGACIFGYAGVLYCCYSAPVAFQRSPAS